MYYTVHDLVHTIEMLTNLECDISLAISATEIVSESEIFDDEFHKKYLSRWTCQKNRYIKLYRNLISKGFMIAPPVQECIKKIDDLFRRGDFYRAYTYSAINAYLRALLEMLNYEATLELSYK